MTIGIVLSQPPGYSETFFNSKIKGLQENGHEVILFTGPSQSSYKLCKHIKSPMINRFVLLQLISMGTILLKLIPNLKSVRRFITLERQQGTSLKRIFEKIYLNAHLLQFKGDWLHYGFATLALDRELVAKAVGAKMAVSFRGFDLNVYPLKHPNCYQLLWNQVDKVQSISSYLLDKAFQMGLAPSLPNQIITPAVDLTRLPQREEKYSTVPVTIVTIARYNWIKGIDYLVEVATQLAKVELDFKWYVIGSGHSFEKERYKFHIHKNGLENRVVLTGSQTHEATLKTLSGADIYVQTSLNEGFCNAVLEAQALGIPCVAFKVGGLPENIKHGQTGWLVEPYEINELSETVNMILNLSSSQKNSYSKAAMARVKEQFSLNNQKRDFNRFYMD